MLEDMLKELETKLNGLGIYDIRQIARAAGVQRPSDGTKGRLIDCIMQIASGAADPVPRSARGAPHKSDEYDRGLFVEIQKCRELSLALKTGVKVNESEAKLYVGSNGVQPQPDGDACGILEKRENKWFLRKDNSAVSDSGDIVVNDMFITRLKLREGDKVAGVVKSGTNDGAGLVSVTSVNGFNPDAVSSRRRFENLTAVYPDRRLKTACGQSDVAGKFIDFVCPLAAGQRVLISAPFGVDKTAWLRHIGRGIEVNNPQVKTIVLLTDVMPEAVTEYKRSLPNAEYFIFRNSIGEGVKTVKLALAHARRLAELSYNVVLIVDDMTKLSRFYTALDKKSTSAVQTAHGQLIELFSSARNFEEGGSLTVITGAAFGSGNSETDEIYYELSETASLSVALSRELSRLHISPPVDVDKSGSAYEEKYLGERHLKALVAMRSRYPAQNIRGLIEIIQTSDGEEEIFDKILKG